MNKEEYDTVVNSCMVLARLTYTLDVQGALEAIDKCETVAPFVNPTLYMAGTPKLDVIKQVLEAVRAMQVKLPTLEQCIDAEAESDAIRKFSGMNFE